MTERQAIKVAVVTGAGSGIGLSCALRLAKDGAFVIAADRDQASAEATAKCCGGEALAFDVSLEDEVSRAAQSILERHGAPHALVNAAGVLQRTVPPTELRQAEWDQAIAVHLRGAYLVNRAFGLAMAEAGQGAIVNIASVAATTSGPLLSYGPAKAGVLMLTQTLAVEWGPFGVRVNAVSPGFTATPALKKGVEHGVLDAQVMKDSSALDRLVEPEEVAAAVAFLVGDAASGVTGVNLPVDAGFLAATSWHAYGGPRRRPAS